MEPYSFLGDKHKNFNENVPHPSREDLPLERNDKDLLLLKRKETQRAGSTSTTEPHCAPCRQVLFTQRVYRSHQGWSPKTHKSYRTSGTQCSRGDTRDETRGDSKSFGDTPQFGTGDEGGRVVQDSGTFESGRGLSVLNDRRNL